MTYTNVLGPCSTVLIIEDNVMNRTILKKHLTRLSLTVIEAEDGLIALEKLQTHAVDLIITDIIMPNLTGIELLKRLKQHTTFKHIPTIVCSSLDEIDTVVECIQLGADDYLIKPFNKVILQARVKSYLERKLSRDHEQALYSELQETQRQLTQELSSAANYITSLIPAKIEEDIRTDWYFKASSGIGGDALGYHNLGDDYFACFLLDVSGHGVESAMLAVTVLDVLNYSILPNVDFTKPGQVAHALHTRFEMKKHNFKYFTIWYGVYHRPSSTLHYCSCWHPAALLIQDNKKVQPLNIGGPAITGFEHRDYPEGQVKINQGDQLIMFSDGIYEVYPQEQTASFNDFSDKLCALSSQQKLTPANIVKDVMYSNQINQFDDDISILEIEFVNVSS